jgi:putative ATP-binding cassette transporter
LATTGLRQVLRDARAMTRPYWFSDDRWAVWGLLLSVIVLNLRVSYISVLLNMWKGTFYDALQEKNYAVVFQQMIESSCVLVRTALNIPRP